MCQFLSTLLVLAGPDELLPGPGKAWNDARKLNQAHINALLPKLRQWRAAYPSALAAETARRCLQMLAPEGMEGWRMEMECVGMKITFNKGVPLSCNAEGCSVGAQQEARAMLMQCSR